MFILREKVDMEQCREIRIAIFDLYPVRTHPCFRSIFPMLLKGTKFGCIVFNVTKRETFEGVREWADLLLKHAGKIPVIIVGNCLKPEGERQVSREKAEELARELSALFENTVRYMEVTPSSVNDLRKTIIEIALQFKTHEAGG